MAERGYPDTFTYIEGICITNEEEKTNLFVGIPRAFSRVFEYISQTACEQVSWVFVVSNFRYRAKRPFIYQINSSIQNMGT